MILTDRVPLELHHLATTDQIPRLHTIDDDARRLRRQAWRRAGLIVALAVGFGVGFLAGLAIHGAWSL